MDEFIIINADMIKNRKKDDLFDDLSTSLFQLKYSNEGSNICEEDTLLLWNKENSFLFQFTLRLFLFCK